MNTHDKYELPAEFRSGNNIPVERATITRERMLEILQVAIEADRKRRGEPVAYGIKAVNTGKIAIVLYGSDVDQVGEYRDDLVAPLYTTPHQAEPVKVSSDEELYDLAESMDAVIVCNGAGDYNDNVDSVVNYARAVLARYGQSTPKFGEENDRS